MRLQRQQGASLIEVLVALTLVAFTMLGLLGLQLRSMSAQKDSLDRRTAALLVSGLGERISANFLGFEQRLYDGRAMNPTDLPPAGGALAACATPANCSSAEIANRDWDLFRQQVRDRLPGGVAFLRTDADLTRGTTVVVGWVDTQRVAQLNAGNAAVERDKENGVLLPAGSVCPDTPAMNADLRYRCYVASVFP